MLKYNSNKIQMQQILKLLVLRTYKKLKPSYGL